LHGNLLDERVAWVSEWSALAPSKRTRSAGYDLSIDGIK
jgi:hypothetical protein